MDPRGDEIRKFVDTERSQAHERVVRMVFESCDQIEVVVVGFLSNATIIWGMKDSVLDIV